MDFHENLIYNNMQRQAIYGFRGASSDGLAKIKEAFKCAEYNLTLNFRSSPEIINVANTLMEDRGYLGMRAYKKDKGRVKFVEFKSQEDCLATIVATIKNFTS